MTKEQIETIPDLSQELASMGRGSMQARIQKLEAALRIARTTLDCIASDETGACNAADLAMRRIDEILEGT